jgi:hypothetical protein
MKPMKKSYILYPNLTDEEIMPENGKFTEAELASIVGPARKTIPVELECLVPSGTPGKFTMNDDEDAEELNQSDYVVIADANNLGEQNASAAVLASTDHIYGTAILALKEHLHGQ